MPEPAPQLEGPDAAPEPFVAAIIPPPAAVKHCASLHESSPLDSKFVSLVQDLEKALGMPVCLFIQRNDNHTFGMVSDIVRQKFFREHAGLKAGEKVALLIDSPGGIAKNAFQIAKFLRHHCGGFVAVVPRYAKSAATLLALGGDEIIFGPMAELGPLDVQIYDGEVEDYVSALDEVQSLERLQASALEALDQTTLFLLGRTGKKVETALPMAMKFISDMFRPLFEKVDVVHLTQRARSLKVAEEYATRLLTPRYSQKDAEKIARRLVEKYPEHGFVIDADELQRQDTVSVEVAEGDLAELLDNLIPYFDGQNIIGRIILEDSKNEDEAGQ